MLFALDTSNLSAKKRVRLAEGYGSFSVSFSALEKVRDYIRNQEEHHAHESFDQEDLKFLNYHNIQYDERFVLG